MVKKMKARKRGRPPLGRKAMTAAQRQARRRERVRKQQQQAMTRPYQPPPGYGAAKRALRAAGHRFELARMEWGFEGGTFVDGVFLDTSEVMYLAELSPREREQQLAEALQPIRLTVV